MKHSGLYLTDPDRVRLLSDLASALKKRGRPGDLEDAVSLRRAVLELRPADHTHRYRSLESLELALISCFSKNRRPDSLAIILLREALELRPTGHPRRAEFLDLLATALKARFDESKRPADLEDVISLLGEALDLMPVEHPDRAESLNDLASALIDRRRPSDVKDAIILLKESLKLKHTARSRPYRAESFHLLATALKARYDQTERPAYLENAISFLGKALGLINFEHPDHSKWLVELALYIDIEDSVIFSD